MPQADTPNTDLISRVSELERLLDERQHVQAVLEERLRFEQFITELSAAFVNLPADQVDQEIENGLRRIVAFLGIDRSTLSEFSDDQTHLRATHSWAAEGIEPFPKALMEDLFPWFTAMLRRGEMMRVERHDELPDEAAREEQYSLGIGLKSNLALPLMVGGEVLGVLSFASFRAERRWPDELVGRLRLVGQIFANALVRSRSEQALHKAFEEIEQLKDQLHAENLYLREEVDLRFNHEHIVGQSKGVKAVLHQVEQVAGTDATVLLLGETGTGKELFAHAVHQNSTRSGRAMIKVNCAALPADLIENELFGHEKGAFTGAVTQQAGRFELADGSTIFLDEIGDLPLPLQAKLLRVLQEGEFERLGNPGTHTVDVRVVAATNRDLEKQVREGRFREDLYYRLNVFPITIPPLRERPGDIPQLVWTFVRELGEKMGKHIETIPRKRMEALERYPWPGNVRELRNVVERAMIITQGTALRIEVPQTPNGGRIQQGQTLEEVERDHILKVLNQTRWRVRGAQGAAEILGLKPTTLESRMQKLGIHR